MADDLKLLSIDDFENSAEGVKKYITYLEQMRDAGKDVADALDLARSKLELFGGSVDHLAKLGTGVKNLFKNFDDLEGKIGGLGGVVKSVKDVWSAVFDGMQNNASDLGKAVAKAYLPVQDATMRSLINPLKSAQDVVNSMDRFVPGLKNFNDALRGLAEVENIARTAVFATSGSFENFEEKMAAANDIARDYPGSLKRSANATGFLTSQLREVDKVAQIIPDTFKSIKINVNDLGGAMTKSVVQPTHIAMTALRGLGFEASEMGPKVVGLYKEFGETGIVAANAMAEISTAGKMAGVSTKLAYEQIESASKHMAIFGRGVSSAAETWADFNLALRDTVPVQKINEMVGSFVGGISKMTLQHRAFIAQVSGAQPGAGMLGGGLKMEMAMRTPEGMQENVNALTKTLSQFAGGRIITLEQAVKMPELETQFVLQRQMLGKLAGVTGQEEQNRVLEVLNRVQSGGMSQITASKELGGLMKGGQSVQEKSLTFLENIAKSTRQMAEPLTAFIQNFNAPMLDSSTDVTRDLGTKGKKLGAGGTRAGTSPTPGTIRKAVRGGIGGVKLGQRSLRAEGWDTDISEQERAASSSIPFASTTMRKAIIPNLTQQQKPIIPNLTQQQKPIIPTNVREMETYSRPQEETMDYMENLANKKFDEKEPSVHITATCPSCNKDMIEEIIKQQLNSNR